MMDPACAEYDVLRNKNRLLEQESNSLFLYDLCQTVYPSPRIWPEGRSAGRSTVTSRICSVIWVGETAAVFGEPGESSSN